MNKYFTKNIDNSFDKYLCDNDEDAFYFLTQKDSFRDFKDGLTKAIQKSGYYGTLDDAEQKADYLMKRLEAIGADVNKKTVTSWFRGTHRPKVQANHRKNMYEICFALHFSIKDVYWFFHHVYFDRAFNCHLSEEVIFYYCFINHLDYKKAQELTEIVARIPATDHAEESICKTRVHCSIHPIAVTPNFTKFAKNQVEQMHSEKELLSFFQKEKAQFTAWNHSAQALIHHFVRQIQGPLDTKPIIDQLKREVASKLKSTKESRLTYVLATPYLDRCGLAIQEILWDAKYQDDGMSTCQYIHEMLNGKSPFKNTFILSTILTNSAITFKETNIPYIIRNNFPSKKVLSDILEENKADLSKSYDSIRKVLVLLHFYIFWCKVKTQSSDMCDYKPVYLCEIYRDEANACLNEAGYEPLYAGNPYDWLFLCSANNEDPLAFFRNCVSHFFEEKA